MSIIIGCYVIARNDLDEIVECLKAQETLANVVVLAIDAPASKELTDKLLEFRETYLPDLYVYKQMWENDFSKARNNCLSILLGKYPECDYVYWVDSDDVWDPSVNFDRLTERLEAAKPNSVILPYNYTEGLILNRKRFWKVTEDGKSPYTWVGAAHEVEQLVLPEYAGEVTWDEYKLIHNKMETPEESNKKRTRNIKILQDALQKEPGNARNLFYLSRELYNNNDYYNAIPSYYVYLNISDNVTEKYQAYLDLMNIYVAQGEFDKAIDTGLTAVNMYPKAAFASTLLGDIYRVQEKWALAAVWYEHAINAVSAPVIFDFVAMRTIAPLRWMSVACQRLGRMDEASYYHMRCGNCEIQDGLQEHNSVWLFSNKHVPDYLKPHFQATEIHIDPNNYMIVKNFNNVEIKESIKSIICYNEEMAIVRILNEGTPEAAAVIFKGYNDFKEIMTEEEKEQIRNYSYEDLVHPTQFTLFEEFYKFAVDFALNRVSGGPINIVELGSDQGLSARFFINNLGYTLRKATFIDTNIHPHLFPLIDNQKTFFIQDLAENAAEQFEDNSLDIIHHDVASHSYEAGKRELDIWIPKLKKTGIIIMHDVGKSVHYNFSGRRVLEELRYPWAVCFCPESPGLEDVSPGFCYRIDY
jgi:glycosyltransferase involved in cell wall biosynthesis